LTSCADGFKLQGELDQFSLEAALVNLGRVLEERGLAYDLVTIGGSSLMLLGLLQRPTRDLDVVAVVEGQHYVKVRELPGPLQRAVEEIGQVLNIGSNWLNLGPADLMDFGLPEGFSDRTEVRKYGPLTLHVAGRTDQIALKLYASADQGVQSKHFQDLQMLRATHEELINAARWTTTHDPSEGFRGELIVILVALGVLDASSLI
jgi:hypothetical protein